MIDVWSRRNSITDGGIITRRPASASPALRTGLALLLNYRPSAGPDQGAIAANESPTPNQED